MQACVEIFYDDKGIIWPERISPARVHLMDISESKIGQKTAEDLYQQFEKAGISVIYDDRDCSPGNKFADSDLIGCPYRVMLSKRTLDKTSAEIKNRKSQKEELTKLDKVVEYFKKD
jgi:prolyl-tRNA synthetase